MVKRLLLGLGICTLLALTTSVGAVAQEADPSDQVKALLTAKGYTVGEAGYLPDEQGNPLPNVVFVSMDAVSGDLDGEELAQQTVWGFVALARILSPGLQSLLSSPVQAILDFLPN